MIEDFNHVINIWINNLENYDFNQLCTKPSITGWSLGQVYMHLIDDTNFYLEQIKLCLSSNKNNTEEASRAAKTMFLNNGFPDKIIEGAPSNLYTPQPGSKEQLRSCLMTLKDDFNKLAILVSKSLFEGKTRHPGLGYFNANEWLQFCEMHFRHHLRQKKRIDAFLKIN